MMFFKTFRRQISVILIASFIDLNIHTTAVAAQALFEMSITQNFQQSQAMQAKLLPFFKAWQQAFQAQQTLQGGRQRDEEKPMQESMRSFQQLMTLTSMAWTVSILKIADTVTQVAQHVFIPFLGMLTRLQREEEQLREPLANPLELGNFLESELEKFKRGEAEPLFEEVWPAELEGWKAEISWDGKVKLAKTNESANRLHVQSLTAVILDNIRAKEVRISAPQVQLTGEADIETLDINFEEDSLLQRGGDNEPLAKIFELTQTAVLNTQNLTLNGILLNKGHIDLKDPAKLKAQSVLNMGSWKAAGDLTVDVGSFFQNVGIIEAQKNVSIQANVIRQIHFKEPNAQMKAKQLRLVAAEDLFLDGVLEATYQLELTSLNGKISNTGVLKATTLTVSAQENSQNEGRFDSGDIGLHFYGGFPNTGIMGRKDQSRIILKMEPQTVFDQEGLLQAKTLTLEGDQWTFLNHRTLTVTDLKLQNKINFSNRSPLSQDERDAKTKPQYQTFIQKIIPDHYTGTFRNEGFATLQEILQLPIVQNTGFLVSKTASIGTFLQGGTSRLSEKLTVTERLDQRGILISPEVTLNKEGTNFGKMIFNTLRGEGRFIQSGEMTAIDGASLVLISIADFKQEKQILEPRFEATKARITSTKLENGENTLIVAKDLTIESSSDTAFTNAGTIKATTLKIARSTENGGTISVDTLDASKNWHNIGDVTARTKTTAKDWTLVNDGTVFTGTLTGYITSLKNSQTFTAKCSDDVTFGLLKLLGASSVYQSGGRITTTNVDNQGHLIWTNGIFTATEDLIGSEQSHITMPEKSGIELDDPIRPNLLRGSGNKISAKVWKNKGTIHALQDLQITTDTLDQKLGRLDVKGDTLYKGKTAVSSFENTPFKSSKILGSVKIDMPFEDIVFTKPVELDRPLVVSVWTMDQKGKLAAPQLQIKAGIRTKGF